jgi:dynein intermediate chain
MDWTFNLWSKNMDSPLLTFDLNDDYMYDIKWHPTHPALFTTADGSGKLDVWDLNKDHEVPSYSYEVGKEAINKTAWAQDGRRMAVAETNGRINILNFDKKVNIQLKIDYKS